MFGSQSGARGLCVTPAVPQLAIIIMLIAGCNSRRSEVTNLQERLAATEQERDELKRVAEKERAVAQAVNDFLTKDLLAAVAPSAESGKAGTF